VDVLKLKQRLYLLEQEKSMESSYPLIGLHRHLEGCVRPETIIDVATQYHLALPARTVDELRPYVQIIKPVADVMTYITRFELMQYSMVNYDVIRRITFEVFEDANSEGVDYLELRFSPLFMAEKHSLDLDGVVAAVCDGYAQALESLPLRAKLIGIMSRTFGPALCWDELKAVVRGRDRGVVAVDLAGDEINYPAELFVEHFQYARSAGMHITVHAGESTSDEQVQVAIEKLGAERLGHAVRAVDSPEILDMIAERSIGIESCLTSNLQTGVVKSYAEHPLPIFLERNISVTLNTDSTVISNVTLHSEYQIAKEELGLSEDDLEQIRRNALQVAFLSDDEREELMKTVSQRKS